MEAGVGFLKRVWTVSSGRELPEYRLDSGQRQPVSILQSKFAKESPDPRRGLVLFESELGLIHDGLTDTDDLLPALVYAGADFPLETLFIHLSRTLHL